MHDRLRVWAKNNVHGRVLRLVIECEYDSGKLQLEKATVDTSDISAKKAGILLTTTAIRGAIDARYTHLLRQALYQSTLS